MANGDPQVPSASKEPWFRNDQPFWLPPGSIQAMLIMILVVGVVAIYLVYKWAPPELMAIVAASIPNYINYRKGISSGTNGSGGKE